MRIRRLVVTLNGITSISDVIDIGVSIRSICSSSIQSADMRRRQ